MVSKTELVTPSKREGIDKTSMSLNHELWSEIKHTAIDLHISATEFVEISCREQIIKIKNKY